MLQTYAMTVSSDGRAKISSSMTDFMGADVGDVIEITVEGKQGRALITGGRVLRGRQAESAKAQARESRGEALAAGRAKVQQPKAVAKSNGKTATTRGKIPTSSAKKVVPRRKTVVQTEVPAQKGKGASRGKVVVSRRGR